MLHSGPLRLTCACMYVIFDIRFEIGSPYYSRFPKKDLQGQKDGNKNLSQPFFVHSNTSGGENVQIQMIV